MKNLAVLIGKKLLFKIVILEPSKCNDFLPILVFTQKCHLEIKASMCQKLFYLHWIDTYFELTGSCKLKIQGDLINYLVKNRPDYKIQT